jgi:uncharacterized protein YfiM (DUF2279 family)
MIKSIKISILCLLFITYSYFGFCQNDSINKKRLWTVTISETALTTASFIGLNTLWYKDYPRSSFHFFNDNVEWLGLDKAGHLNSSYHISRLSTKAFQWTGLAKNKAILYGGSSAMIYMTGIEVLDGFSAQWGFSWGDMLANTGGAALFMLQEWGWEEQRMRIKFSFMPSKYAQYRPELLGSNILQQSLKDYNGQTHWLSINPHSFLREDSRFPKWLNIAFGYGADGMTGGVENPPDISPYFERYSQYYFSLDLDLEKIPCKRPWVKTLLSTLNLIKIPFPALEYNKKDKMRFHVVYF